MAIHCTTPTMTVSKLRESVQSFPKDARLFTTATVQFLLDIIAERDGMIKMQAEVIRDLQKGAEQPTIVHMKSYLDIGCDNEGIGI